MLLAKESSMVWTIPTSGCAPDYCLFMFSNADIHMQDTYVQDTTAYG